MKRIQVCMGSACYLKGAPLVVQALQDQLAEQGIAAEVELMGSFCQNQCLEGVLVKIDGEPFSKVTPKDIPELIKNHLVEVK